MDGVGDGELARVDDDLVIEEIQEAVRGKKQAPIMTIEDNVKNVVNVNNDEDKNVGKHAMRDVVKHAMRDVGKHAMRDVEHESSIDVQSINLDAVHMEDDDNG